MRNVAKSVLHCFPSLEKVAYFCESKKLLAKHIIMYNV